MKRHVLALSLGVFALSAQAAQEIKTDQLIRNWGSKVDLGQPVKEYGGNFWVSRYPCVYGNIKLEMLKTKPVEEITIEPMVKYEEVANGGNFGNLRKYEEAFGYSVTWTGYSGHHLRAFLTDVQPSLGSVALDCGTGFIKGIDVAPSFSITKVFTPKNWAKLNKKKQRELELQNLFVDLRDKVKDLESLLRYSSSGVSYFEKISSPRDTWILSIPGKNDDRGTQEYVARVKKLMDEEMDQIFAERLKSGYIEPSFEDYIPGVGTVFESVRKASQNHFVISNGTEPTQIVGGKVMRVVVDSYFGNKF